jgi:hypothetical protein
MIMTSKVLYADSSNNVKAVKDSVIIDVTTTDLLQHQNFIDQGSDIPDTAFVANVDICSINLDLYNSGTNGKVYKKNIDKNHAGIVKQMIRGDY